MIVDKLIAIRANEAFKKHESNFFDDIYRLEADKTTATIYQLMPPRKRWLHVGQSFRKTHNLTEINKRRLALTIKDDMEKGRQLPYLEKLEAFSKLVEAKMAGDIPLQRPSISFVPKDHIYWRPITLYKLADRIAINIAASLMTDNCDHLLEDCAVAFRSKEFRERTGLNNHHQVFKSILHWKMSKDVPVYVAEADIKGFYDNVDKNHIKGWLATNNIDEPLINCYLDDFSFYGYLLEQAEAAGKKLKHYRNEINGDILNYGIPQGGALSCFFANVVFLPIDRKIMDLVRSSNGELIYYRYCDDMVILGTNQELVKEAFSLYLEGTKALDLPIHSPVKVESYSKDFWAAKSKDVYQWSKDVIPWFSFLGYQMRYDNVLRMRPKSIAKELEAQKTIVDKILYRGWRSKEPLDENILYKLENRFFKRITGFCRRNFGKVEGFSWKNGYSLLNEYPHLSEQFRLLDKKKIKQLNRLVKKGFKRPPFYASYYQTMRRNYVSNDIGDL
jgi:hypothetical protein